MLFIVVFKDARLSRLSELGRKSASTTVVSTVVSKFVSQSTSQNEESEMQSLVRQSRN